ncbi:MAG: MFS transporter [Patescibacteria group bacterium]
MKELILKHWNSSELPSGVRVITFITSIRWFGWGFGETLIPVMIYSFGHSFAQAGLLSAGYEVGLILTLPIIGIAADRMKATTLILIGLAIYLFVGSSYLLAGITGLAIFIIIARFLNGIAYSFDSIGRQTYFMRHTPASLVATAFGYLDTVADFWWIVAALLGIILVQYVSIPVLLFFITPFAAIGIVNVIRFRRKEKEVPITIERQSKGLLIKEFSNWNQPLKALTAFNFFITAAATVVAFFVPIEAHQNGASLAAIVVMGVISTIPTLFGWDLGKLFDVKGSRVFTLGLLAFAVLMFSLVFLRSYIWQVAIYFLVNVVVELLYVGNAELVSLHANPEHLGKITGIMRSTGYIGGLTGPLAAGVIMDSYGVPSAYAAFGVILLILAVLFYFLRKHGYLKNPFVATDELLAK